MVTIEEAIACRYCGNYSGQNGGLREACDRKPGAPLEYVCRDDRGCLWTRIDNGDVTYGYVVTAAMCQPSESDYRFRLLEAARGLL